MILDVRAGRTILRVKEVLLSGLLLLEGKGGREYHEHSQNCAPYHLPIEGTVYLIPVVVQEGLPCFVCGEKKGAVTMLLCEQYQRGWHMTYLRPPLSSLPSRQWSCPHCRGFFILGASTNHTQCSYVVFIILCLPKWKMRSCG